MNQRSWLIQLTHTRLQCCPGAQWASSSKIHSSSCTGHSWEMKDNSVLAQPRKRKRAQFPRKTTPRKTHLGWFIKIEKHRNFMAVETLLKDQRHDILWCQEVVMEVPANNGPRCHPRREHRWGKSCVTRQLWDVHIKEAVDQLQLQPHRLLWAFSSFVNAGRPEQHLEHGARPRTGGLLPLLLFWSCGPSPQTHRTETVA